MPLEAQHFIKALCPPGGLVVDPMMCSGTTAVAAVKLGLEFIGIEKDPGAFNAAKERVEAIGGEQGGHAA